MLCVNEQQFWNLQPPDTGQVGNVQEAYNNYYAPADIYTTFAAWSMIAPVSNSVVSNAIFFHVHKEKYNQLVTSTY